jgi:lysozyme
VTARDLIKREEGCRLVPYLDSKGLLTIGYGHCLERRPLPESITNRLAALGYGHWRDERRPWPQEIADDLFAIDCQEVEEDVLRHIDVAQELNEPRYAVLLSMAFQMGTLGVLGFRKMLAALRAKDYALAAIEMLDSDWHFKDSPERARRHADIMRTGTWPA